MSKLKTDQIKPLKTNTLTVNNDLVVNGNLKIENPNPIIGPITKPNNFYYSGMIEIPITAGLPKGTIFSLYNSNTWVKLSASTFNIYSLQNLVNNGINNPPIYQHPTTGYWWKLPRGYGRFGRKLKIFTNLNSNYFYNSLDHNIDQLYGAFNQSTFGWFKLLNVHSTVTYYVGTQQPFPGVTWPFRAVEQTTNPSVINGTCGGVMGSQGYVNYVPGQAVNASSNYITLPTWPTPIVPQNPFEVNAGGPGTIYIECPYTFGACPDQLMGDYRTRKPYTGTFFGVPGQFEEWISSYVNLCFLTNTVFPNNGVLKLYYTIEYL